MSKFSRENESLVLSYDKSLFQHAEIQWGQGELADLLNITPEELDSHPERRDLAILIAVAHATSGEAERSRFYVKLAIKWGASKKDILTIFIAGLHCTLGKVYLAKGDCVLALKNYEAAMRVLRLDADTKLVAETRAIRDATKLGFLPQAYSMIAGQFGKIKDNKAFLEDSRMQIVQSEIDLLRHELSLAQQRMQIYRPASFDEIASSKSNMENRLEDLKSKSMSQLGQDLWVLESTDYKKGGFFVEFGATDGVLLSNTWLLEKFFDWKGICAEPNPVFFDELKKNRGCIVSDQYIGRLTGDVVDFVLADVYGGALDFHDQDNHKEKREAYISAGHLAKFTSISLNDFLIQHNAPNNIDYISIDTEGSEFDLLSSFPFSKWDVRLFSVEHNFSEQRDKIRELMLRNGYSCIEKDWDDWYRKNII